MPAPPATVGGALGLSPRHLLGRPEGHLSGGRCSFLSQSSEQVSSASTPSFAVPVVCASTTRCTALCHGVTVRVVNDLLRSGVAFVDGGGEDPDFGRG
jgi:hypothetical protein